ncbi:alpha/beta hydrolase family protein [Ceratobasidium sp. AG-Ba]|nr:alpha/beta hydrolase family protein [Ceratobasidium sp. AG-Ba]
MVLFPPFLREGAHRKKQEPNSTHHCAIFSHNSPSIVGDADIEWWPVDATQEQSEQSIPDFVFLFIPGNPGLVEFYTDFLDDIHRDISKTGKRLEIFVRGHIGHAPNLAPAKNALWSVGLEAQVMSVVELYDSIQDTYGPTVKVILGGHSVGAWIVTQVMHSRPNTAAAAFLLFPTWLFHRPIPTVVSSFTRLLSLPPLSLVPHSLPYLSKFHEYPSSQLEAHLVVLLRPSKQLANASAIGHMLASQPRTNGLATRLKVLGECWTRERL